MARHMRAVRDDPDVRASLIASGLATVRARHTCAHRADELLAVLDKLGAAAPLEMSA
jgi:spore maturation protein CgeB